MAPGGAKDQKAKSRADGPSKKRGQVMTEKQEMEQARAVRIPPSPVEEGGEPARETGTGSGSAGPAETIGLRPGGGAERSE